MNEERSLASNSSQSFPISESKFQLLSVTFLLIMSRISGGSLLNSVGTRTPPYESEDIPNAFKLRT